MIAWSKGQPVDEQTLEYIPVYQGSGDGDEGAATAYADQCVY